MRAPAPFGLNLTLMVQLAPPARLVPQVWLRVKSLLLAPVRLMPVRLRAALPLLVKVTSLAALVVPMARVGKLRLFGDKETAVPMPLKLTLCGLLPALSVSVSVPLRGPAAVGLKVTRMVQLAPPARLVPQLLVWAKSPLAVMLVMSKADCRCWTRSGFSGWLYQAAWCQSPSWRPTAWPPGLSRSRRTLPAGCAH